MLVIAFTDLVAPKRAVVLKKESPLWEVIHLSELKSDTFYTPGRCFLSVAVEESRRSTQAELNKNGKDDLASQSCSGYDLLK